jgi:hypothetical protein
MPSIRGKGRDYVRNNKENWGDCQVSREGIGGTTRTTENREWLTPSTNSYQDSDTRQTNHVRKRTLGVARSFMADLATRIATRFQLTTDSLRAYVDAVDSIFGTDIDYAMLHKNYREEAKEDERRYSPAQIIGITKKIITGEPRRKHISTSYVERQNLTMRMQMRRFTRLTNGFSKSLRHLEAALALHFFHYNFMRIHETLRVTPAMEAGVSRHLCTWEDLLRTAQRKTA